MGKSIPHERCPSSLAIYQFTNSPIYQLLIDPLDPTADAAQNFVGDGADLRRHLAHVDAISSIWLSALLATGIAVVIRLLLKTFDFAD